MKIHRKAEEGKQKAKEQKSRKDVMGRTKQDRNNSGYKANIFLLSDADNNDQTLVKINHDSNKGKFGYYIKANF